MIIVSIISIFNIIIIDIFFFFEIQLIDDDDY